MQSCLKLKHNRCCQRNREPERKEERSQYWCGACQNGDSKVNEEILCSFGYLFKNRCTSLDWFTINMYRNVQKAHTRSTLRYLDVRTADTSHLISMVLVLVLHKANNLLSQQDWQKICIIPRKFTTALHNNNTNDDPVNSQHTPVAINTVSNASNSLDLFLKHQSDAQLTTKWHIKYVRTLPEICTLMQSVHDKHLICSRCVCNHIFANKWEHNF